MEEVSMVFQVGKVVTAAPDAKFHQLAVDTGADELDARRKERHDRDRQRHTSRVTRLKANGINQPSRKTEEPVTDDTAAGEWDALWDELKEVDSVFKSVPVNAMSQLQNITNLQKVDTGFFPALTVV
jgi:hypothetical protein